jgi:hypothetical protein
MDCEQVQSFLVAHMDRELPRSDRAHLDEHLQGCAACRASAEALRLQDADLRRAFAPRRRAAALVASRVIAQLPAKPVRARHLPPWLPLILSAAAGFLVAVAVFRPWARDHGKEDPLVQAPPQQGIEPSPGTSSPRPKDQLPQPEPETVLLTVANKAVEIRPPGNEAAWQMLRVGQRVALGTLVRTDPMTRCEFHTDDGSEVSVNGDSELRFVGNRQVELARGQILTRVAKAKSPFQVHIPKAVVTGLGTEFDILCKPADSILTVIQGSTEVEGRNQRTTVREREWAKIVDGLLTEQGPAADLNLAISWTSQLLSLKGQQKELAKRVEDLLAQLGQTKMAFIHDDAEIRGLGDHCVRPLTSFLKSPRSRGRTQERQRAARILADLAQTWSIPDLITLLKDEDPEVRFQAAQALNRLTHQDQGCPAQGWRSSPRPTILANAKRWEKWWAENKQRYPAGAEPSFGVLTPAPPSTN